MIDGAVIKQFGRDDLLDDFLKDLLAEFLSRDRLSVLGGDDDGVDAKRDGSAAILFVLDGDLGLRIWAQPRESARSPRDSHRSIKFVREHDGQGHELFGLVRRIAKHDALVTSTVILERSVVKTLGNVGRLLLDGDEDVAGLVVKALLRGVVTNLLDRVTDDLLVINVCLGGDLAEDHDHAGLRGGLASNLGERVLLEASIKLNRQGGKLD